MQLPVDVDHVAFAQQPGHPGALLGQEAGVFLVALPVLQIDRLVRDVDVATQDEITLAFEGHQVRVELGQKAELGGLALFAGGAAGKVGADDGVLAGGRVKAQLHITAFGVKLGRVVADHHIAGFQARVDTHARIALFLGQVEVALEPGQVLKFLGQVGRLGLDLLHANTIEAGLRKPGFQAFAGGRTDAVEVQAG